MKILKALALSLCVIVALCGTGCNGEKIDSVESIMATYGTNSIRIYPSNINAYELEQEYTQWDIFVSQDIAVSGITFLASKLGDEQELRVRAELVEGESVIELCAMTQVSLSEKNVLNFSNRYEIKKQKGENNERQVLRLIFSSIDGVKFRLSEFRLTTD